MLQNACQICNMMVFDTYILVQNEQKMTLEAQIRSGVVFLSIRRNCDYKTFFVNFPEFFRKRNFAKFMSNMQYHGFRHIF